MQVFALCVWIALMFGVAAGVNFFAKRPLMNPWVGVAGSYGLLYLLGLFVGLVRSAPNLAYVAGSFLPITIIAIALGLWRAPKWRAAKEAKYTVPEMLTEPMS
jgi:hypothetical protein